MDKGKIIEALELLKTEYPVRDFPTNMIDDPYYVLISCLLSLRTKDAVTSKASARLFDLAKTPEDMLGLSDEDIEKAIYPVGFYHRKARTIKEISRILIENYGSIVPDTIDELVKLKGVGRKTANIVITQGYKKPGIAVDVHVHRLSNRLGWVKTKDTTETEYALKKILPKEQWKDVNELLVKHGQNVCKPRSPECWHCVIKEFCNFSPKNLSPKK